MRDRRTRTGRTGGDRPTGSRRPGRARSQEASPRSVPGGGRASAAWPRRSDAETGTRQRASDAQDVTVGVTRIAIPASAGVRSPLR